MSFEEVFAKLKTNSANICDEAIRILVKIADNVVKSPDNLKVRSLQKSNSIVQNKVLGINGGRECLKLMGFQETDTCFILPVNVPVTKVEEVKNSLMIMKSDETFNSAAPRPKVENQAINSTNQEYSDDLDNVKRYILPPFTPKLSNPFLRRIETHFHHALAFGDKQCQQRAKKLIPLDKMEEIAQQKLRYIQTRIKKEKLLDPEFSFQDMLLLELLKWFKEDFFSWVDTPECNSCGGTTVMSHMSTDPQDLHYTKRVEVYKCGNCQHLTKFPRYNDLNILLETRRGRCGEWAQVFTIMCRSLGWDARYVIDELDHVWTEVYSITQKRWVHCDPCENACDTPLIYENGWNKKLTYIIAYSPDEVQDVTWRYSSKHKEILGRRKNCTEMELINALIMLRNERQKTFSKFKKNYLTKRLINELIELMVERQPHENESHSRISGSETWRVARGEMKNENMYVWRIENKHIINNKLTVKYSTALDAYEFITGDDRIIKVSEWNTGVYNFLNIFRKEEKDWKNVYLARSEGADEGRISWKYELEHNCDKTIENISLICNYQIYENGLVHITLVSDNVSVIFPKDRENFTTNEFSGKKHFTISVNLSGGKGNVAWQHAQLFRQPMDSKDFPFVLSITFRDNSN